MPCKRRTCPRYAPLWAYDWRIVLLENLIAYGGKSVMYTLTPPGADVLPFDTSRCSHPPQVRCSGTRGCVVEEKARRSWNASCQERLSRLYETAQAAVRREAGVRANVLAIGKEAQQRGPVHVHYVLGVETAEELRAAKAFRRHLERLSRRPPYLFGHVNGKFVKPKPAREAAAYLSSYFLGGRGHKAKLTEAVLNRELPRLPLYVSRRLTRVTRTTMRNKRRQRHLHVCRDRGRADPPWAAERDELDTEARDDSCRNGSLARRRPVHRPVHALSVSSGEGGRFESGAARLWAAPQGPRLDLVGHRPHAADANCCVSERLVIESDRPSRVNRFGAPVDVLEGNEAEVLGLRIHDANLKNGSRLCATSSSAVDIEKKWPRNSSSRIGRRRFHLDERDESLINGIAHACGSARR